MLIGIRTPASEEPNTMVTPRVSEIAAVCAHLSVPLGGWPVRPVPLSDSEFPLGGSGVRPDPPSLERPS